jgi:sigma-B regulation protein RsbU (phosphoserine phosphatase)
MELSSDSRRLMQLVPSLRGCLTPFDAIRRFYNYLKEAYPGYAHAALSTRGLPPGSYRICALIGDDGVEHMEFSDLWKGLDQPIRRGGTLGEISARGVPQLVRDLNLRKESGLDCRLVEFRELIAVPLPDERLPVNWYIRLSRKTGRLTPVHLEQSAARVALVAALLNSLEVADGLAKARRYIDAEVDRMARIQRALLPNTSPRIPGLEIDVFYRTFARVGGDFYDFFPLGDDDDPWCIVIGDAAGHGPSAAVVAAIVQAVLHDCARRSKGPSELLAKLNRRLCRTRVDGSFVTTFLAFFHPRSRRLTFAGAGHPMPMVGNPDGAFSRLSGARNPPLGIDADLNFHQNATTLRPGQTVVFYTDGISEACDPGGNEFGDDGIRKVLRGARGARSLVRRLETDLSDHQRRECPRDDQTVLAIHVESKPDEPICPVSSWRGHEFDAGFYTI